MHRQLLCFSTVKGKRSVLIYFCYQTDSGVPNTSIYSAVFLASSYYNYLWSTASTTMICWRHSNSVNTGSRLPRCSEVKTRKRRNVVGIDMIRNNRIENMQIDVFLRTSGDDSIQLSVPLVLFNITMEYVKIKSWRNRWNI